MYSNFNDLKTKTMTAEDLYKKEFGDADSVPKESVIRLLRHFAKAIELERKKALRIHDVVGQSEQCCEVCDGYGYTVDVYGRRDKECEHCK